MYIFKMLFIIWLCFFVCFFFFEFEHLNIYLDFFFFFFQNQVYGGGDLEKPADFKLIHSRLEEFLFELTRKNLCLKCPILLLSANCSLQLKVKHHVLLVLWTMFLDMLM